MRKFVVALVIRNLRYGWRGVGICAGYGELFFRVLPFHAAHGKNEKSRGQAGELYEISQFCLFYHRVLGQTVACRYLEPPDLRNVAISALKCGLLGRYALRPFLHLVLKMCIVACRTGHERHVRILHCGDIRVLRDPDVTSRAILDRMRRGGLVIELQRVTGDHGRFEMRRGRAVTTRAIGTNGFLSLVVAAKAGSVAIGRAFEKFRPGGKTIDRCRGQSLGAAHRLPVAEFRQHRGCLVTNGTIIVLRRRIVRRKCGRAKASVNKMRGDGAVGPFVPRDDVLVRIVRKDGCKLLRTAAHREGKTRAVTRAGRRVADSADRRVITLEKIAPMTLDTRGMAGIIGNIREPAHAYRVRGGGFMARCAI